MEFLLINESDLINGMYKPLNVVFTLVHSKSGYMLVQNRDSSFWELPAGEINEGEAFEDCAGRRCKETSGQVAKNLELIGLCKMTFENRDSFEYFAIYSADLEEELPYAENYETKDMRWYKPGQDIEKLCNTCRNVIDFYESIL